MKHLWELREHTSVASVDSGVYEHGHERRVTVTHKDGRTLTMTAWNDCDVIARVRRGFELNDSP